MDIEKTHKAFAGSVIEATSLQDQVNKLITQLEASTTRSHFWKKKFEYSKERELILRAQNMTLLAKVADLQDELYKKDTDGMLDNPASRKALDAL